MKVAEFAKALNMSVLSGAQALEKEITGIYIGDLLSWVMSHAQKGNAWITVLTHLNIVAVALLTEVACIIVPEDIVLEEATINKADREGITILSSGLNSYEISCRAKELLDEHP